MPPFAIIVPCYNEAARLPVTDFISFTTTHTDVQFYFVNDGCIDDTNTCLEKIKAGIPSTIIINLQKNSGKGEAVRQGMKKALQNSHTYIGYLDADLSASPEELYRLYQYAVQHGLHYILASRIQKIDTTIERSFVRHLIGRTIATIIDRKFQLGIYDTQCGAKIFKAALLQEVTQLPFHTRWFFDIELLLRINRNHQQVKAAEIPLQHWKNVKHSKLTIFSASEVVNDLITLVRHY